MSEQKQATIVIVDDNAVVREVLRGMIGRDPSLKIVGQAASGEAAIELVKNLNPALVCLDVMLPGVDGLEVLRAIRAANPDVRVILVTGHSTSEVVDSALKAGANGFIVKPFNANKLLQTIHSALAARASAPAAAAPGPAEAESSPPAAEPVPSAAGPVSPSAESSPPAAESSPAAAEADPTKPA